ncbi:response regulator transcription factor [Yinghuangia sp. YIM S09857]|uniref:helix-turn-helix transcriptional regulator n=1 Tax=Yinghuangia sp. YIM S09857 TaxID=3436929 RepID=UPI003F53D115
MERITVGLRAQDPVLEAGLASQVRTRPELALHKEEEHENESAVVIVVVVDCVDDNALRELRNVKRTTSARVVLVASHLEDQHLVSAAECGVAGIVRRTDATPERLTNVIRAVARGEGSVPADLLGRLLEQVGRLQGQVLGPLGLNVNGLAEREIEVLRLIAEGYETADIATKLSYSERTIKNVLHGVISRLHLRNRAHAVAYALRQGLI